MKIVKCLNCNKEFVKRYPNQRCCSLKCRKSFWSKNNKDKVAIMNQNYSQKITKDQRKGYNEDFLKKNPDYVKNYAKKYRKQRLFIYKVIQSTNNRFKKEKECGLCGSKENLNFHHWKYQLPVQRSDFSTLCRPCHEIVHFRKKRLGI